MNQFLLKTGKMCIRDSNTYADLIKAIYNRIDFFNENGCRVSDHALDGVPYAEGIDVEDVFKNCL